jgi:hypothetical protein
MNAFTLKVNGQFYGGEDPEQVEAMPVVNSGLGAGFHNWHGQRMLSRLIWGDVPHIIRSSRNLRSVLERVTERMAYGLYASPVKIEIEEVPQ